MIISIFQLLKSVTFYILHIVRPDDPRFISAKAKDSKDNGIVNDNNHELSSHNDQKNKSEEENNHIDDDQKSDAK